MPAPLTPRRLNPSDPKLLKLTEDTLAAGLSLPTLATRLGCDHRTVYHWLEYGTAELDGEQARPELGSLLPFCQAIERGLQRFESENVDTIAGARSPKPGGWQPAAWLLERRLPDRWGQKRDVTIHDTTSTRDVLAGIGALTLQEITRRLLASQNDPQGVQTDIPLTLPEATISDPNHTTN